MRLILVPSPLLGPTVWEPVARFLRERVHDTAVPALPKTIGTPADVLEAFLTGTPAAPCVLVPHSNASLYVAALVAERPLSGIVFVDARLPQGNASASAEPGFRAYLGGLVDAEGLLPPWSQWWPEADVEVLFPHADIRSRVGADLRRLPLSFFDEEVSAPAGWEALPAAYLAFGQTYAAERAAAHERGWPVETLGGEHLHQLLDPDAVADSVVRLLQRSGLLPRKTDTSHGKISMGRTRFPASPGNRPAILVCERFPVD